MHLELITLLGLCVLALLVWYLIHLRAHATHNAPLSQPEEERRIFLRDYVEHTPECIIILNREGCNSYANAAACRLTGYTCEELQQQSASFLFPQQTLGPELYLEQDGGQELLLMRKDGQHRHVIVRCVRIVEIQVLMFFTDITERVHAEEALGISEEKYRQLFDRANDAIYLMDTLQERFGHIVDVNTAACQMHGYSREELLAMSLSDIDEKEDDLLAFQRFDDIAKGEWLTYEASHRCRDGTRVPVEVSSGLVELGKTKYLLGFARDITRRKHDEQALLSRDAILYTLANISQILFSTSEMHVTIPMALNEFARTLHYVERISIYEVTSGATSEETHVRQSFHWDRIAGARMLMAHEQTDDVNPRFPQWLPLLSSDQFVHERLETMPVSSRAAYQARGVESTLAMPICLEGDFIGYIEYEMCGHQWERGEIDAIQMATRTIGAAMFRAGVEEKLRHLVQNLERSNADLAQFAYVASHDLQEPLRMVSNYVELLAQRYQGQLDARADKYIGYVVDGAQRMIALISDLLSYSRIGSDAGAMEPLPLQASLQEALENLSERIRETNAQVRVEHLPVVMGNRGQLTQVFQNIVGNALKYTGAESPVVCIAAERVGNFWQVRVRDNGIGIDPQYREKIFGIFQRLHTRHEYPGTGIGLALCKNIIERHGGTIHVESELGHGATFYFTVMAQEGDETV